MAGSNRSHMAADSEYFTRMLDMIPPENYFAGEVQAALHGKGLKKAITEKDTESTKKRKNKKDAKLSTKAQLKRMKYDPNVKRSISQLVSEVNEIEVDDDVDGSEAMDVDEDDDKPAEKFTKIKNKKQGKTKSALSPTEKTSSSIEDARQKLQARIQELKSKRSSNSEAVEMKRLKRKARKLKFKEKKRNTDKQNKNIKGLDKVTTNPSPNKLINGHHSGPKPIFSQQKMVFSKFDFRESGEKQKTSKMSGKDYKTLLEKVERKKQNIEELRSTNVLKARKLEKKDQWEKALQKAEGLKVKDDPEMLKKALKRKEKIKDINQKKWKGRTAAVEQRMQEQQDKRKRNIRARKDSNLKNKIDKAKKRGRIIPGF